MKKRELLAKIETDTAALLRDQERQKAVEAAKQERELIKLRANELTQTQVRSEQVHVDADALLYKMTQEAEAKLIAVKKEAEGQALRYKTEADGKLQISLSEAEGEHKKLEAEGLGMAEVAKFSVSA